MHYGFRADSRQFHDWLLDEIGKYPDLNDTYPDGFPAVRRVEIATSS